MKGYTTAGVFLCVAFLFGLTHGAQQIQELFFSGSPGFLGKENEKMVRINGKKEDADGMVLQEYLVRNGYPPAGIAVECNEEMVAKSRYAEYVLKDGDVVEIVSFVGGG